LIDTWDLNNLHFGSASSCPYFRVKRKLLLPLLVGVDIFQLFINLLTVDTNFLIFRGVGKVFFRPLGVAEAALAWAEAQTLGSCAVAHHEGLGVGVGPENGTGLFSHNILVYILHNYLFT
jgi:hypothetical protein